MNIIDRIQDERNIFNSIYSLESYVFEMGLLDTTTPVCSCGTNENEKEIIAANDLELYHALSDKYNIALIEKVIGCCRKKLNWIFESNEHLFDITVYFKFKNYDAEDNSLSFRPMHTARLIDMICMVSIMNCLMFDDDFDTGNRKLSDLSKLLPHNFYGNIPSTDVRYLFCKWQTKYKDYTNDVIEHCRAYQHDHSYLTEVCLDIKNFFPSISPKLLFDYIIQELRKSYENEMPDLCKVVAKLLYFNVNKENISRWEKIYYPVDSDLTDTNLYMNCGIPQGLPQSYFFGNLCMIEVRNQLMKENLFNGDAYFYVDDSVIFIKDRIDDGAFKNRIDTLNKNLSEWCESAASQSSKINDVVSNEHLEFQNRIKYEIQFHEDGKSTYTNIDDTDNHYGPIADITRLTSMHSRLTYNLDEVDDHVSLEKLEAIDTVISNEINRLSTRKTNGQENDNHVLDSRLKLLKRFRKFFLYRNKLLKIRESGGVSEAMIENYNNRFLRKPIDTDNFFNQFEEEIFQSEYRLLIQKLSVKEAKVLSENIKCFETDLFSSCMNDIASSQENLFYSKDAETSYRIKSLTQDPYVSLVKWAKENLCGQQNLKPERQMEKLRQLMLPENNADNPFNMFTIKEKGFSGKCFTSFVAKSSSEYQRRILNVYFSQIMDVIPSDALTFTKNNSRRLKYYELRILAYLRNHNFDLEQFEEFVKHIDEKDISNQMGIDMGILEVLNIFIKCVRNPEWIDSLIVTHRLTKGLWYNGSKFLNSYTLHNEEHAVTLINKSLTLTNRIDYFVLKNIDYYILFLACYLHDISMVIHPDLGRLSADNGSNKVLISKLMSEMSNEVKKFEIIDTENQKNARFKDAGKFLSSVFNEVYGYFESLVRDRHAKDSASFVLSHSSSLLNYLEPTLLSFVAKVSESHGYDTLDVYGLKSRAKDNAVSLKYLMIIIRFADLLDVANDRVNYHLLRQNLHNMSLTSRFHWISHLVADKIELETSYTTDNNATLTDKSITETINVVLYLNFKQMTISGKKTKCKGCEMYSNDGEGNMIISIEGNNDYAGVCSKENCPVLCSWMMKKHKWLVDELKALNDYLFSVNNTLFKTRICFVIKYNDDMKLDADMFDSVQEYLK